LKISSKLDKNFFMCVWLEIINFLTLLSKF
jgi:hypothetical protein